MDQAFGKVGRNEPCPCGSGLRFKACHGNLSDAPITNTNPVDAVINSQLYPLEFVINDDPHLAKKFIKDAIATAQADQRLFFSRIGNLLAIRESIKNRFGNGTMNLTGNMEELARLYIVSSEINGQIQGYQSVFLRDLLVAGKIEDVDELRVREIGVELADQVARAFNEIDQIDQDILEKIGREFMWANFKSFGEEFGV